jgi:hypothetical protein
MIHSVSIITVHDTLSLTLYFRTFITAKWSGSWFLLLLTYCESDQIMERHESGEVCLSITDKNRSWNWVLESKLNERCPNRFTPQKSTNTYFTGCCLGPSVSLDGCGYSRLQRDPIPEPSSQQRFSIPNTTRYSLPYNWYKLHTFIHSISFEDLNA